MLAGQQVGSYIRYKADTNYIATWLVTNKEKCSVAEKAPEKEEPVSKRKKSNRKTRMQATPTASDPNHPNGTKPPQAQHQIIHVKDFVSMARSIVTNKDPEIVVPAQLLEILDRAIELRKQVARKHGLGQGIQNSDLLAFLTQASNQRHLHFIKILEEVKDVLRQSAENPLVESGIKPDAPVDSCNNQPDTPVEDDPQIHFQNVTTTIQYDDEPAEDHTNDESVAESAQAKAELDPAANSTGHPRTNDREIVLAIDCLLEDLQNLRSVIQETWTSFLEDRCDLVAASLLSQAAVGLARGMEEEIDKGDVAALGGVIKVYHHLMIRHAERLRQEKSAQPGNNDDETHLFEALDQYFYHTYVIIGDLVLDSTMPSDQILRAPGCCHLSDKLREDSSILRQVLSQLHLPKLKGLRVRQGFDDEYVLGMKIGLQEGNIKLWAIFATQIYLDIHHILGEKLESCSHILRDNCATAANNIRYYTHAEDSIQGGPRVPKESPAGKQLLSILHEIEKEVLNDLMNEGEEIFASAQSRCEQGKQKLALSEKHPIQCGMLTYLFQEKLRKASIDAVNSQSYVLATIHLYNSLKQERLLKRPWKDMEFLLAIQSPLNLFLGETPKSTLEYSRKFDMAVMGASVTKYVKDKGRDVVDAVKGTKKNISERGYRKLEVQAPVHSSLFQRLREKNSQPTFTSSDIGNMVNASQWLMDEVKGVDGKLAVTQKRLLAWQSTTRKQDIKRTISLHDLFRDLRMALCAENLETTFDYLKLREVCQNILLTVKGTTMKHLVSEPETELSVEEVVTNLLPVILMSSTTSTDKQSKQSKESKPRRGKGRGKGKDQDKGPDKNPEKDFTMVKGAAASGFQKHFQMFGEDKIFNVAMANAKVKAEVTRDGTLIRKPLASTKESIEDTSATVPDGNTGIDEPLHNQPEPVTEQVQQVVTDKVQEDATDQVQEVLADQVQEAVTDQPQQVDTDQMQEIVTDQVQEAVTDQAQEVSTEQVQETVADHFQEAVNDQVQDIVTDQVQEVLADQAQEAVTEQVQEVATEQVREVVMGRVGKRHNVFFSLY